MKCTFWLFLVDPVVFKEWIRVIIILSPHLSLLIRIILVLIRIKLIEIANGLVFFLLIFKNSLALIGLKFVNCVAGVVWRRQNWNGIGLLKWVVGSLISDYIVDINMTVIGGKIVDNWLIINTAVIESCVPKARTIVSDNDVAIWIFIWFNWNQSMLVGLITCSERICGGISTAGVFILTAWVVLVVSGWCVVVGEPEIILGSLSGLLELVLHRVVANLPLVLALVEPHLLLLVEIGLCIVVVNDLNAVVGILVVEATDLFNRWVVLDVLVRAVGEQNLDHPLDLLVVDRFEHFFVLIEQDLGDMVRVILLGQLLQKNLISSFFPVLGVQFVKQLQRGRVDLYAHFKRLHVLRYKQTHSNL